MTWETPQDIKKKWANLRPSLEIKTREGKKMIEVGVMVSRGLPIGALFISECPLEPCKQVMDTFTWWQPIRRMQSVSGNHTGLILMRIGANSQGLPIWWSSPIVVELENLNR